MATGFSLCVVCGDQFDVTRLDSYTCGRPSCRKAFSRGGRRIPGDDRIQLYRPSSLSWARKALDAGVPLNHLTLSRDERDVVVVACRDRFHWDRRGEAAGRLLAGRFSRIGKRDGLRLDPVDVMVAIESARKETTKIGNWRGGRRRPGPSRRIAPYVPAEYPFALLFRDYLSRMLEQCAESLRQQAATEPRPIEEIERIKVAREIAYTEAKAVREVVGYTLPTRRHIVAQRPAFPPLHFDEDHECPLDDRTPEYRKARFLHYNPLYRKAVKPGEEVEVSTTETRILEELAEIRATIDRIEAAQSGQLQEQLGREAEEYLEEVDD